MNFKESQIEKMTLNIGTNRGVSTLLRYNVPNHYLYSNNSLKK